VSIQQLKLNTPETQVLSVFQTIKKIDEGEDGEKNDHRSGDGGMMKPFFIFMTIHNAAKKCE
jgi:hypothetical protein